MSEALFEIYGNGSTRFLYPRYPHQIYIDVRSRFILGSTPPGLTSLILHFLSFISTDIQVDLRSGKEKSKQEIDPSVLFGLLFVLKS
ncbi:uncharacterized protein CIMG_13577 [Coccidioides immitis RS]|uniref:Uncharacterized protein n=1 Tax=Coccidioides immitis (strain RS) TaxID=246410 RepID=A0A0D8JVG8_COCIM|nr:uncharacterized protein CIMG_13577 [Coccidioides immitis RS]KJF61325.1 hypothetical protein CIMG_13577 [Coccidioides immitis RS]